MAPFRFVLVPEVHASFNALVVRKEGVSCKSDIVQGNDSVDNWSSEPVGVV
jgi:hypothetical protein